MKFGKSAPRSTHGLYLSKIQFFRGFAILLVLLYHLKIPYFSWGFVGVDIFFVLSGYLMMAIYPNLADTKETLRFYRSRWLRIFPALSITLVLMNLVGYFFLLPNESFVILKESFFGIIGLANLDYWLGDQYFVSSTFRPLLNLWSLGVELQFYVLYPILLRLIRKYPKALFVLFFLSLSGFLLLSQISPQTIFYLLPFRLWEFIGGIFLAQHKFYSSFNYVSLKSINRKRLILPIILTTTLTIFIALVSSLTALSIIFTVLCTVILLSFQFKLGNKSLIKIKDQFIILGDYSYIVYLLHFPIIILMNYEPLEGNKLGFYSIPNLVRILTLVAILAYLGHRFVEKRIKQDLRFQRLQSVFIPLLVIFVAVNFLANFNSNQFSNYPKNSIEREVAVAVQDQGTYRCGALARLTMLQYFYSFQSCIINKGHSLNRVLLVGDSHADAIKETLAQIYSEQDSTLLFFSENRGLDEILVKRIQDLFEIQRFNDIILHSSPGGNDLRSINALALWSKNNNISLFIIGPIPVYGFSVPLEILKGHANLQTIDIFEKVNIKEIGYLRTLDDKFAEVRFIDMGPIFCSPACALRDPLSHKILYRDHGHLSLSAKNLIFRPLTVFLTSQRNEFSRVLK